MRFRWFHGDEFPRASVLGNTIYGGYEIVNETS